MRILIFCAIFSLLVPALSAKDGLSPEDFRSPDRDYAPMTWWHWINGHLTKDGIRKDLLAMHKVGIRGVQVFNTHMYLPPGPVEFNSEEWYDLTGYAIRLCDSLGMKFCITSGAGWSGSGGPWITKDRAMKRMTMSETRVPGGKVRIKLEMPPVKDDYYREIVVQAIPAGYMGGQISDLEGKSLLKNSTSLDYGYGTLGDAISPRDIKNLTAYVDDAGWLDCELPEGEWNILRFGYTLTGKKCHPAAWGGEGYEVNKLDSSDVMVQYEQFIEKLFDRNKEYLGNTFEGVLFDSYEAGFQNWTTDLPGEFRKMFGYDLIGYMPVFTGRYVESRKKSEQVLYDFRTLLDYMLSENYYGTMKKRINERGMVTYAEAQGGPVPSRALNYVDVPMNEFWNPDTSPRAKNIRLTASQADLRRKSIVAAEAFTSKPEDGKWQNYPGKMKKPGDLAYVCGVNRFCFHTYAHQPVDYAPGFALGRYGTMFSRLSTWWDYSREWITYLTRCQYMLQQGIKVADIAFLFHYDIRYMYDSRLTRIPQGFDYVVAYPEDLSRAVVRNGRIIFPNGSESAILFVIPNAGMDLATLKKIEELARQGAVICGEPPVVQSSYSESLEYPVGAFDRAVKAIWGSGALGKCANKVGKGLVLKGYSYKDAISYVGIEKDVDFGEKMGGLHYLHKKSGDCDFYFLSNQNDVQVDSYAGFRVGKKFCSIWDPVTGDVYQTDVVHSEHYSFLNLSLAPLESVFVVFTDYPLTERKLKETVLMEVQTIKAPWKLVFEDTRQVKDTMMMDVLVPINESMDPDIRYYSGTIAYSNSFECNQILDDQQVFISFDEIFDIGEVLVNGHSAGVLWTRPFCLNITPFLQKGTNFITVRVANSWINRIIGDEQLIPDLKYEMNGTKFTSGRLVEFPEWMYSGMPADRERLTFTTWKHYGKNSPLSPSGLSGEVRIEVRKVIP